MHAHTCTRTHTTYACTHMYTHDTRTHMTHTHIYTHILMHAQTFMSSRVSSKSRTVVTWGKIKVVTKFGCNSSYNFS